MQVVLFTGKGGVGKTTAAAGAATLAARAGRKTLVVSTDGAHSLGDAFGVTAGADPVEAGPGLWVQQVDAQRRLESSWGQVRDYLRSVLGAAGVEGVAAEEITVVPGAEEVVALLEVREQAASGRWDLVVVDCAPTAETLRLLALPEAFAWYVDRVLPRDQRVVRALAPVLGRATGLPVPDAPVLDALERLHRDLGEVHDLLTGPSASVRLVLTPERVVVAEARRALTTLSLFGYRVDGVVANRVFPTEDADAWRAGWAQAQAAVLADVRSSFGPVPVWTAPYLAAEPVGGDAVAHLAARTYLDADPFDVPAVEPPLRFVRHGEDVDLELALPFATTGEVDLARSGHDLVVTVGSHRRLLALPDALARREVARAGVVDGRLRVRFATGAQA